MWVEEEQMLWRPRHTLAPPNAETGWVEFGLWREWGPVLNLMAGTNCRREVCEQLLGGPETGLQSIATAMTLSRKRFHSFDADGLELLIRGRVVGRVRTQLSLALAPMIEESGCEQFTIAGILRRWPGREGAFAIDAWVDRRISPGPEFDLNTITDAISIWPSAETVS